MTNTGQMICFDKETGLAYRLRRTNRQEALVFIHGFGSNQEHFRFAFSAPPLLEFTLLAVDLAGFGASPVPPGFSFTMHDQALLVLKLLDTLQIINFHLCGHSMGGLVVMNMAELAPGRTLSLINLEGNLTPEDCFLSGKVAAMSFTEFTTHGRKELERGFRLAGMKDPAMRDYAETFAATNSKALYKSALHTVQDSALPLVDKLGRINNSCYIYGDKNRTLFPAEKLLHDNGVPVFYIENAGHAMALENPRQLYNTIRQFIDSKHPGLFE
ncbi:MAG TPA: alpha/beta hydrolase [bacterium]|nr:alpha/beta hydrolase [bacterium]HPN44993.1 alpha/beta hydrolase [bacterium]